MLYYFLCQNSRRAYNSVTSSKNFGSAYWICYWKQLNGCEKTNEIYMSANPFLCAMLFVIWFPNNDVKNYSVLLFENLTRGYASTFFRVEVIPFNLNTEIKCSVIQQLFTAVYFVKSQQTLHLILQTR
jgi:hypothetical protein